MLHNLAKDNITQDYGVEVYAGTSFVGKKGSADYLVVPPDTSHLCSLCVYVTCDASLLPVLTVHDRKILHRKGILQKENILFHCYPYKDVYIYYYVDNVSYIYYYILPFMRANNFSTKDGKKIKVTPLSNRLYGKVKNNELSYDNYKIYESMKIIPFDTIEWYYKNLAPHQKYYVYCGVLSYSTTHCSYSVLHPFDRKLTDDMRQIILEHVDEYYDLMNNKKKVDKSILKSDIVEFFADYIGNKIREMRQYYQKATDPDTPSDKKKEHIAQYKVLRQKIDNIIGYLYTAVMHQDMLFNLSKNILYYGSTHLFTLAPNPEFKEYLFATSINNVLRYPNTYSSDIWGKDILFRPIEETVQSIAEEVYTRYKEYINENGSRKDIAFDKYSYYNLYYNRFYVTTGFYYIGNNLSSKKAARYADKKILNKMLPCLGILTYNPRKSKIYLLSDKEILQQYHPCEDFVIQHRPTYSDAYYDNISKLTTHN